MKVRDFSAPDTRPLLVKAADYRNSREDNYMPPITLGRPNASSKEAKRVMAMDASIKNVLSGIQDELSYMAMPKFLGYAMLSNISQEALIRAGVETIADEMTRKFVEWTYDVGRLKTHCQTMCSWRTQTMAHSLRQQRFHW